MTDKILLEYNCVGIIPFGDGESYTAYNLLIEKSSLFGIFKRKSILRYEINMFQSISETEKHWDMLITTKKLL